MLRRKNEEGDEGPKDPRGSGGDGHERPMLETMHRERPYRERADSSSGGFSRPESDRRRQRSLSRASEFSTAHIEEDDEVTREREEDRDPRRQSWLRRNDPKLEYDPRTRNNELENIVLTSKINHNDPFMSQISENHQPPQPAPYTTKMGLVIYQPGSSSSMSQEETQHPIQRQSTRLLASEGPVGGDEDEDDSSSTNSDFAGYRRRSSTAVGPQEQSDLLRAWTRKRKEELEEKPITSERMRQQILENARKEMSLFYATRLTELQTRRKTNREKERVYNEENNLGNESKAPLNLWRVVVSMLPPAPIPEKKSKINRRVPSRISSTPKKLMTPSTYFSEHHALSTQSVTPPGETTSDARQAKDLNKDSTFNTEEEGVVIPKLKVTDISRMRQILMELKNKPPDVFNNQQDLF